MRKVLFIKYFKIKYILLVLIYIIFIYIVSSSRGRRRGCGAGTMRSGTAGRVTAKSGGSARGAGPERRRREVQHRDPGVQHRPLPRPVPRLRARADVFGLGALPG